jgi:hypothetical protein
LPQDGGNLIQQETTEHIAYDRIQRQENNENVFSTDCEYEHTSHDNIVSKALCTTAIKHWDTAGVKFGVSRYSNTQLNELFDLFNVEVAESTPPLQLKRNISKKATASRYVALTPEKII